MTPIPVIIGFGGINAAGRSSFHHAYRRIIHDNLDTTSKTDMLTGLATLTRRLKYQNGGYTHIYSDTSLQSPVLSSPIDVALTQSLLDSTLIRPIRHHYYDTDNLVLNQQATLLPNEGNTSSFIIPKRHLPKKIPSHWHLEVVDDQHLRINVTGGLSVTLPDYRKAPVSAAGQLPDGFDPSILYPSRNHPRNLQMTVYGASDALASIGIEWSHIQNQLAPDRIAVYASNSIGQMDDAGFGGLLKNPSCGKRITSKQMPLGYGQMPADFVNAYLLGSVGAAGSALGACATFLYNLKIGVEDITSGRRDLVLVGSSDAPITPEVMEGFRTMGALAEDKELCALDNTNTPDLRRTSRPFSSNCGFTMGESSQWVVLTSDTLALKLGAQIFAAVPGVFINADGHKKSITSPGIGNYVTLAKTCALARSILGENSFKHRSCVQAHGTSTPQNRTTESHVINQVAKAFGIDHWRVGAIKAYLGHSQGSAGGDQLTTALGLWEYGLFPGISTIDHIADDVYNSNLNIAFEHAQYGPKGIDSIVLNSKGFGGNNASALLMSPHSTHSLLLQRHGKKAIQAWQKAMAATKEQASAYDEAAIRGTAKPFYYFNKNVLNGDDVDISDTSISIKGYAQSVDLNIKNPFI